MRGDEGETKEERKRREIKRRGEGMGGEGGKRNRKRGVN